MNIRIAAALALCSCATLAAPAAEAPQAASRSFAVMSLIGDSLTVVTARPVTGSHVNQNETQALDDSSGALDLATLHAADEAIRSVDASAAPILLATDSPVLHKRQSQLIDGGRLVDTDGLVGELKKAGATDLLLITKHRASTALQAESETLGNGTLYGLGFYIDGSTPIRRSDTGAMASGFLAPYAYFQITLVDVATLAVEKQVSITAGKVLSNARNQSDSDPNPWNVLSGTEKFKALNELISDNLKDAVPKMIAASAHKAD